MHANVRRYVLFAYPTIGGLAWFLQIAAQLKISHVDNPAIAPLPQVCRGLQSSLFINRVIADEQKP